MFVQRVLLLNGHGGNETALKNISQASKSPPSSLLSGLRHAVPEQLLLTGVDAWVGVAGVVHGARRDHRHRILLVSSAAVDESV